MDSIERAIMDYFSGETLEESARNHGVSVQRVVAALESRNNVGWEEDNTDAEDIVALNFN